MFDYFIIIVVAHLPFLALGMVWAYLINFTMNWVAEVVDLPKPKSHFHMALTLVVETAKYSCVFLIPVIIFVLVVENVPAYEQLAASMFLTPTVFWLLRNRKTIWTSIDRTPRDWTNLEWSDGDRYYFFKRREPDDDCTA